MTLRKSRDKKDFIMRNSRKLWYVKDVTGILVCLLNAFTVKEDIWIQNREGQVDEGKEPQQRDPLIILYSLHDLRSDSN